MDKLGGDVESGSKPKQTRRRHLLNNIYDIVAIAISKFQNRKVIYFVLFLACLIFGLIYLLIDPNQRGFFCDDTSIQYPIKKDTIPMWLLGVYGGIGPIVIVKYLKK